MTNFTLFTCIFVFIKIGLSICQENKVPVDLSTHKNDDLIITKKQLETLQQFREIVSSRLTHNYMKSDIYLIKWLRARKFNLIAAETFLMENIQWRKKNDIDNILNEDWSYFGNEYKIALEGCDRFGRPVITVLAGLWDVRKAVISGKNQQMMRYFDKLFEEISIMIRNSQDHGQNITQYDFVIDLANYNLILQGCPLCIPVYTHFFQSYENHYPLSVFRTTLVNVPDIFMSLWQVINPFLSLKTRKTISLYGKDKAQWQSVLLEYIDETHLTNDYGGLKEEPISIDDIRADRNYFNCSEYAFKGY